MWQIREEALPVASIGVSESLYTLGNGYLGIRGFFEEWPAKSEDSIRGTYLNGVYDRVPMDFGERAVGFPEWVDKQPRVMDTQSVGLYLDGEALHLDSDQLYNYERTLDFKTGLLTRQYQYKAKSGKTAQIKIEKMVSFTRSHLSLSTWTIAYEGQIVFESLLNGNVKNYVNENDPRVAQGHAKLLEVQAIEPLSSGSGHSLICRTKNSNLTIGVAVSSFAQGKDLRKSCEVGELEVKSRFEATNTFTLEQYSYFTDSRLETVSPENLELSLKNCCAVGKTVLYEEQRAYLEAFWQDSDIEIYGSEELQTTIRFNLFHLLQSVGKDGKSNISAKGLSGEGYEGHYFWDTEIYVLPLLSINQPKLAKELLQFRHSQLPEALEEARKMGHEKGAKYPWRTISGIECSGYFPAGTAQYHINADIAYGIINYVNTSGDKAFLYSEGLQMLVETSRFWLNVGQWVGGSFKINCVTGPDEYTALVDNNFYTNGMAQHQLMWTLRYLQAFKGEREESYRNFVELLNLTESEIEAFKKSAEHMYLPRDLEAGIDLQDDQFMNRAPWPFETVSEDHYPLLLHYHPLIIYRHQVLKQADTVLAHLMLPNISDKETMSRSFHFYEALTTHDSSLSSCVYGTMAARLGEKEKAWNYFMESVNIDLKNTHGNTKDGLHMANLAGSCLTVLKGFAGLTLDEEGIHLNPWVPEAILGYSFKVRYGEAILKVTAKGEKLDLNFMTAQKVPVYLDGQLVTVAPY